MRWPAVRSHRFELSQCYVSTVAKKHDKSNQSNFFNLVLFVCFFSRGSSCLASVHREHRLYSDPIFLGRQKMQLPKICSSEATVLSLKYSQATCLTFYLVAFTYNLWLTHPLIYSFVPTSLSQFSNVLSKPVTLLKHPHRFLFWFLRPFYPSGSPTTASISFINQLRSRLKL